MALRFPWAAGLLLYGFGYVFFGGIASAVALVVVESSILASGWLIGWPSALAISGRVFVGGVVLFVVGMPASVIYSAVVRDRVFTDNDPIVDWLPWIPSGGWIIDRACQGRYLPGGAPWMLTAAWAVLALPVWMVTIWLVPHLFGS